MKSLHFPQKDDHVLFTIVLWWLGNIVFGLIPLLTVLAIQMVNLNPKANAITNTEISHFLADGGLNFFFLALIGSVAVDIYSARKRFINHFAGIMIALAGAIGIVIAFIYLAFVLTKEAEERFGDMLPLTIGLGITAFFYCTVGKVNLILIQTKSAKQTKR